MKNTEMSSDNTVAVPADRWNPRVNFKPLERRISDNTWLSALWSALHLLMQQCLWKGDSLVGVVLQKCGGSNLVDFAHCHAADKFLKLILISVQLYAIHFKENDGRNDSGSFVAVYKRMVLCNVEQISCGHFEDVFVEIIPAESSGRHRGGGLQQSNVSYSGRAAVPLDLVSVDFKNLINTEKLYVCHLIGQPLQGASVSAVRSLKSFLELGSAGFVPHWRDDEYIPIGRDLDRSIGIYLEQIEHASLDHQRHAVSVFGEFLNHGFAPSLDYSVHTMYHHTPLVSNSFLQPLKRVLKLFVHEVSVDFSGGDVAVVESALNEKQIGGSGIKMGSERVPQAVRCDVLLDSGLAEPVGKTLGDLSAAEAVSARRDEQCGNLRIC